MEIRWRGHYIPSMNHNLKSLMLLIILGLLASSALSADPLWDKALIHAAPRDTSPLTGMRMEGYQTNRAGEITKTTTMEFALDDETGELLLIAAFEDDKDVTEKEQRKAEKNRDEDNEMLYVHAIFNPEKADGLVLTPTGTEEEIQGTLCVVYDFRMEDERKMGPGKPKEMVEEGRVYLEKETGMPLRVESHLVEGPNAIREMSFVMEAFADPDGNWRPDRIDMEFNGHMFVYIAGGFSMSFIYNDI